MSSLLILGAGGHSKVVVEIAVMMNQWDRIAFLDDREDLQATMSFPVIGRLQDFLSFKNEFDSAFVAIGDNALRIEWVEKLACAGFAIPTLIHPFSAISRASSIAEGSVVMAGVVINANTCIGKGCIINTSSSVGHDCTIGDGVHISPGVRIGGTVVIQRSTWICIGSSIINNVSIGPNTVVGAGSVVINDLPGRILAAGCPAITKKQL